MRLEGKVRRHLITPLTLKGGTYSLGRVKPRAQGHPAAGRSIRAASGLGCNSLPPSGVNPLGQALWQATREAYWKAFKNVRPSADVILKVIYLFDCRS